MLQVNIDIAKEHRKITITDLCSVTHDLDCELSLLKECYIKRDIKGMKKVYKDITTNTLPQLYQIITFMKHLERVTK